MSFDVPTDLRYTESHEWIEATGETRRVGITDFAQDELGDIVFVELPAVGTELEAGEEYGVVESIKAVSDVYVPVSGTVAAVNEELADAPESINEDPYGDGWLIELEGVDEAALDGLLGPDAYEEQTE
ncbi:glycine cleavage system protein GcvH [Halobellus rufus]|uniref:glycine cleavage system protein GcvH n=1 Tax=Halobellus rufus TaxID=1448860 RepID=UPI000679A91D|nr:glycine cleavage system protein GcvH [Halobellus rufus]